MEKVWTSKQWMQICGSINEKDINTSVVFGYCENAIMIFGFAWTYSLCLNHGY